MVLKARSAIPATPVPVVSRTAIDELLAPKEGEYCQHEDRIFYQETVQNQKESCQPVCERCSYKLLAIASGQPVRAPEAKIEAPEETMKAAVARPASAVASSPATTKAEATKKAAPAKKAAKPAGEGRPVGKTLKLGVGATWVHIFQENEARAKSGKPWSDEQITEFLNKEFPDRKSDVFKAVATVRSKYNNGGFNDGTHPKVQSHPYNKASAVKEAKKK